MRWPRGGDVPWFVPAVSSDHFAGSVSIAHFEPMRSRLACSDFKKSSQLLGAVSPAEPTM
ncbi:hypothetical protein RISK_004440 [Rhodopirellula islandica]|uniref:Uncharacterized protein n=1 Tax=Rhodopirellula islandica TaxID=595434 RepID=A0A0J1BAJ7_RHOIS|nr:hypothetical protein RISK_004440 [Rhodopirellula islandica]